MFVFSDFLSLQELELWGGEFYSDGLFELLQNIGHQVCPNCSSLFRDHSIMGDSVTKCQKGKEGVLTNVSHDTFPKRMSYILHICILQNSNFRTEKLKKDLRPIFG